MTDTKTVTLQVSGMIRATSKNVTEAHLARQPGVLSVDANPVSQTATVTYDPQATSVAHLQKWVIECGYHCAGQSVPDHICDPAHEPHEHADHHDHAEHDARAGHDAHDGHQEHAEHEPRRGTSTRTRQRTTLTTPQWTPVSMPVTLRPPRVGTITGLSRPAAARRM